MVGVCRHGVDMTSGFHLMLYLVCGVVAVVGVCRHGVDMTARIPSNAVLGLWGLWQWSVSVDMGRI